MRRCLTCNFHFFPRRSFPVLDLAWQALLRMSRIATLRCAMRQEQGEIGCVYGHLMKELLCDCRGILSLGLAFFKKVGQKETKRRIKFQCQVRSKSRSHATRTLLISISLVFHPEYLFAFFRKMVKAQDFVPFEI